MKRLIITILAVFYLGVSSGATVYVHYCMGQLVEMGFVSEMPSDSKCGKCGMDTGNREDCCKKEQKHFKIDASYKISENSFQLKAFSTDIPFLSYNPGAALYISSLTEEYPILNAPPQRQDVPTFVRNCNFRI